MSYFSETSNMSWKIGTSRDWNSSIMGSVQTSQPETEVFPFEHWLDQKGPLRFIVDRQGRLLWSNLKHVGHNDGAASHPILSKVRVGGTLPNELLLPILTVGNLAKTAVARIARCQFEDGTEDVFARVSALPHGKDVLLGVTIVSKSHVSEETCADLKRIWNLSSAEIRVLALTLQGQTAQEVADHAGVSIETVRTHIRHIYSKVGVNSREALFAILGPILT
jgi:DNA-binding CsgD family transcriptional regulator